MIPNWYKIHNYTLGAQFLQLHYRMIFIGKLIPNNKRNEKEMKMLKRQQNHHRHFIRMYTHVFGVLMEEETQWSERAKKRSSKSDTVSLTCAIETFFYTHLLRI